MISYDRPLISVIVPNYNHVSFLKERIDSIIEQSYDNFEIIILDDNSTDDSISLINKYKDNKKVKHIIYNSLNSGSTFRQWEKGISIARGEFIWIAESDDVASPFFLSEMIKLISTSDKADIAFCSSYLIDQDSKELDYSYEMALNRLKIPASQTCVEFSSLDFIDKCMTMENSMYNASAVVFKKKLWYSIPKDFTSFRSCGDWLCWLYMLLESKSVIWNRNKLNRFRIHTNKVTTKAIKSGLIFLERKKIVDFLFSTLKITKNKRKIILGQNYYLLFKEKLPIQMKREIVSEWVKKYKSPIIYILFFILFRIIKKY